MTFVTSGMPHRLPAPSFPPQLEWKIGLPWANTREDLPGAGERHSARDKGREEGGSAYAKAGSSLGSLPGYSRVSSPKKPVCLLYCFVLSPLTLLGAVPYHHLVLSVKELTYSSN